MRGGGGGGGEEGEREGHSCSELERMFSALNVFYTHPMEGEKIT
jgi:hypothetical protein